ncbi:MAG: hypothetical protein ACM3KE_13620 [Hyphomicrobiales bacterium]
MKKIGAVVEGLILLAVAVYAGMLVLAGDYWRFLNPKFKWVTGATAAVLLFTATVAILNPDRRSSLSRIVIFLLFLRILTMGMSGSTSFVEGFSAVFGHRDLAIESSRATMNGREYIRINLGELYRLADRMPESEEAAGPYVVRGIVMQSRALAEAGQFALMRVAVYCCLADAVAMGIRVAWDQADEIADGQWVEVYGTLKPLPRQLPEPGLHVPGLFLSAVNDTHVLIPDRIHPIRAPDIPFMFEFRKAEPYAY